MSKVEIEKNVPIPEATRSGRGHSYPWMDMEVGDSFFAPGTKHGPGTPANVAAAGRRFRRRPETNEDGVEGHRVWRVEDRKTDDE